MSDENKFWQIEKKYFVRTVTMYNHGTLVDITPTEIILSNACWIADTGRLGDFVCGKIEPPEIEFFPPNKPILINRTAIIDAVELDRIFIDKKINHIGGNRES